jgi:endo-1,4-beta-xylanase
MIDAVRKRWRLSVCLILFMFVSSVSSAFAQSETVLLSDFENGIQKWEARGARVSIKSDKEQAASGTKSLKVTGRSANWNGAQLNLTKSLSGGKAYKFTVSVKLAKGEAADEVRMTMQWGDNDYSTVAINNANANEWTTFSGKFAPKGSEPFLTIYVEAARANTSYYVDDFKVEPAGDDIPAQSGILLQNDFEDMTAQNWNTYGDGVQMFSSNAGGSQSLKVTGRTANWHGVALDISPMFFKGRTYLISVSAKLLKGQPSDSLKITMKQTPPKGDASYTPITNLTTVTDGDWVTLSGEYKVTTSDNNLLIYVEAAGATTSFYIDNFVVKMP